MGINSREVPNQRADEMGGLAKQEDGRTDFGCVDLSGCLMDTFLKVNRRACRSVALPVLHTSSTKTDPEYTTSLIIDP